MMGDDEIILWWKGIPLFSDPARSKARVTGSPGSILFFKSKRCRFSKKNKTKVNGSQPGFWLGQLGRRVNPPGFSFPYFFFNSAWFQPRAIGFRVDPPGWAGFQNYGEYYYKQATDQSRSWDITHYLCMKYKLLQLYLISRVIGLEMIKEIKKEEWENRRRSKLN